MIAVTGSIAPTGGVVILTVSGISGGPLVYSRSFGSGAYTTIYTVENPSSSYDVFVDYGEGLQGPLPSNQGNYNYQVTDVSGTAYASGLAPYQSLQVNPDFATVLVERSIEAGLMALSLPQGYNRPVIRHEMPKDGFLPLPFVTINQIMMAQTRTQIGQDVPATLIGPAGVQNQTLAIMAKRTWRIEIFTKTAGEREYYRDAILSIFASMLASIFQPLSLDMNHSFMVHSDQRVGKDMDPGFYFSDILYTTEGIYNVGLQANYTPVNNIGINIQDPSYPAVNTLVAQSGIPNFYSSGLASGTTLYSSGGAVENVSVSGIIPAGDFWQVIL